jgi:hypothetical protein
MAGRATINIGMADPPGAFINAMKCYQSQSFGAGATPADLDDLGYPKTTLVANIGGSILMPTGMATNTEDWVLKWPSTRAIKFVINNNVTVQGEPTGASVTGGSNSVMTVESTGVAGRVVFRFNDFAANSISFYFPSGFANGGTGELALVRASDETAYDGGALFTPEWIDLLTDMNPRTTRPMGWIQSGDANLCNHVKWDYRTKPESLSWITSQFPNGAWGGAITGTDQYTIAAAPDTPGTWTANEVIQGKVENASSPRITVSGSANNGGKVQLTVSTSANLSVGQDVWVWSVNGTTEANGIHEILSVDDGTHITIDVNYVNAFAASSAGTVATHTITVTGKTGGAKFLASSQGYPLDFNFAPGFILDYGGWYTLFYDDLLDRVLISLDGFTAFVPIEVQVEMHNELGINFWGNIPAWADDDFVTEYGQCVAANLNPDLQFYCTYSNEVWLSTWPQTNWAGNRGIALGFPTGNHQHIYGWYGLRIRQIMEMMTDIWSGRSGLVRVMEIQQYGPVEATNTYRLKGGDLSTSLGYTRYNSYVGVD